LPAASFGDSGSGTVLSLPAPDAALAEAAVLGPAALGAALDAAVSLAGDACAEELPSDAPDC
jgi:hypothetical protein